MVYRHLDALQALATDFPNSIAEASSLMRAKLDGYRDLLMTPRAKIATILDPRFNLEYFEEAEWGGLQVVLDTELKK